MSDDATRKRSRARPRTDGKPIRAGDHANDQPWHLAQWADQVRQRRARIDEENRRHDRQTGGARVTLKGPAPP